MTNTENQLTIMVNRLVRVDNLGHLEDVGMGYFEHMKGALVLSIRFGLSSIQLVLHAIFPFIFVNAGEKAAEKYNSTHK